MICEGSTIVCVIPSPVWDSTAPLAIPSDAMNARKLVAAPVMLKALIAAEQALEVMADAHEQATDQYQAGGCATDALRVVREAIRATQPPTGVRGLYRVSVAATLTAEDIEAYDCEAAERYARESLNEERVALDNSEVDLGFADGKLRAAFFSLPEDLEPSAMLSDGAEGDPEATMSQATFVVEVPVAVTFDVETAAGATTAEIAKAAAELLAASKATAGIHFDDQCMGSKLTLAEPLKVTLVTD